ncbi:hypothetical protein ACFL2V_07890 [Pseudomonadota bacterium]
MDRLRETTGRYYPVDSLASEKSITIGVADAGNIIAFYLQSFIALEAAENRSSSELAQDSIGRISHYRCVA